MTHLVPQAAAATELRRGRNELLMEQTLEICVSTPHPEIHQWANRLRGCRRIYKFLALNLCLRREEWRRMYFSATGRAPRANALWIRFAVGSSNQIVRYPSVKLDPPTKVEEPYRL